MEILNSMGYGALTLTDVRVLESVLDHYRNKPLKFLEVGIYTGDTARGIRDYCQSNAAELEYIGIDSGRQSDCSLPFGGAKIISGDSAEVFHLAPHDLDVAFIDGCHCGNHVILDTIHYGNRVKHGGWLLFHDTSPEIAQTMRDSHGPDIPWFYNSVLEALHEMDWPNDDWEIVWDEFESGSKTGGMRAYKKV